MKIKTLLITAGLVAVVASACSATSDGTTPTTEPATTTMADDFSLDTLVENMTAENAVPGMAAMVFNDTEILDQAIAGVRQNGGTDAITLEDRFHIGSNTKALTAALIGRLVERGDLSFDMTLSEVFSDLSVIDSSFQDVTIRQLLSHTAGIDDIAALESGLEDVVDDNDNPAEQRAAATKFLLARPSDNPPGEAHAYSNVGYALVGATAEAVTGLSFSELMEQEVFEPLGITTCDFGTPTDPTGQPLGHDEDNQPVPLDDVEDPDALSPAGSVTYCSLEGWARFLQETIRAYNGESDWLSVETMATIVTPIADDYALGWLVIDMGDGRLSFAHDGSNTLNYSSAWITPEERIGWIVVTNASVDPGGLAASMVGMQIAQEYVEE